MSKIKEMKIEDRPREKLLAKGVEALSDAELLAILISSGTRNKSALEIANEAIVSYGGIDNIFKKSYYDLSKIEGISKVKAIQLLTVRELFVRISNNALKKEDKKLVFNGGIDVYNYMHLRFETLLKEQLIVLYLNIKNVLIGEEIISVGSDDKTVNNNKYICKMAVEKYAKKILVCHNHLSGNSSPSLADIASFVSLKNALSYMQIKLIDHVIIGKNEYYSIKDERKYYI